MQGGFSDLQSFIRYLEKRGDLVRVKKQVDPDLEINAILDRLARTDGPAVLFENVKGSDIPLFGNAFGRWERLSQAFGVSDFRERVYDLSDQFASIISSENRELIAALFTKGLANKFKNFARAARSADWKRTISTARKTSAIMPVGVSRDKAPCKDIVLTGDDIDLNKFPLIRLWPQDGGMYATLPLIITRDPENGILNVGIYRMMQLSKNTMCMHWLPQKHGRQHYEKAEKMGRELPVVVAVGADPALEVSGALQLMPPLDEFMVAGMFKGSPIQYTKAEDSDLWVPASAEIIFEGVVKPHERETEGPFGEFHGYYSPVKKTPVFHIRKITMRKNPVWHAATTGMPPTEIHVMAKTMEPMATLLARNFFPGVRDINLSVESGTLYTVVVSMEKLRIYEPHELMHFMWSFATQSPYVTNLIVVDPDVNTKDIGAVLAAIAKNTRIDQDIHITPRGLADLEKPSTYPRGVGARMGIDATTKWPEEGGQKKPGNKAGITAAKNRIAKQWKKYGKSLIGVNILDQEKTLTVFAALKKSKPSEAVEVMEFLWNLAKVPTSVFVVDSSVDIENLSAVFWAMSLHMRPEYDLHKNDSPACMGLDCTAKTPAEGLKRKHPDLVVMTPKITKKVDKNWKEYGF